MRIAALAALILLFALAGCGGGGGGGGGGAGGGADVGALNRQTVFVQDGSGNLQPKILLTDAGGRQSIEGETGTTGRQIFFFDPATTGGRRIKESEKVFVNGVHNPDDHDFTLFNNDAGTSHTTGSIRETHADRKGI